MARSVLKSDFDEAAMLRKLKKLSKSYGESQEQAVKRWGVQTCRELAKYSAVFGKNKEATTRKLSMFRDATNVLFTHKGTAKASKSGKSMVWKFKGKSAGVQRSRYIDSEHDVILWIDQNRRAGNGRSFKLSKQEKKVCSESVLRRAIKTKQKASGLVKDGWLDAGEDIAKGQKGKNPAKIGKGLMKWSRKPARLGYAREGTRLFKSFADLVNRLSYSKKSHVLSTSNKRKAARDGAINTLKWYKRAIRAENKKKK